MRTYLCKWGPQNYHSAVWRERFGGSLLYPYPLLNIIWFGVEELLRLRVFQPHCHMIVKHQTFSGCYEHIQHDKPFPQQCWDVAGILPQYQSRVWIPVRVWICCSWHWTPDESTSKIRIIPARIWAITSWNMGQNNQAPGQEDFFPKRL